MTAHVQVDDRPRQGAQKLKRWYPGALCSICGEHIHVWQRFNFDHIVPVSRGGKRGKVNKALAHCLCNAVKGAQYPFSMRTPAERDAVRAQVTTRTWRRLNRIWRGEDE